jgi:hypothetical protein
VAISVSDVCAIAIAVAVWLIFLFGINVLN